MTGFAQGGYLADLSRHLDPAVKSVDQPGVLDSVTVDGKVIAAPTVLQSYLVFANKKLLDEAGATVPDRADDDLGPVRGRSPSRCRTRPASRASAGASRARPPRFMNLGLSFGGDLLRRHRQGRQDHVGDPELEVPKRIAAMAADGSLDKSTAHPVRQRRAARLLRRQVRHDRAGLVRRQLVRTDAPKGFDWVVLPRAGRHAAAPPRPPTRRPCRSRPTPSTSTEAASFVNFFMKAAEPGRDRRGRDRSIPATQGRAAGGASPRPAARTAGSRSWRPATR